MQSTGSFLRPLDTSPQKQLQRRVADVGEVLSSTAFCLDNAASVTGVKMAVIVPQMQKGSLQTELMHWSTGSMQQVGRSIDTTPKFDSPDCQYLQESVWILPALHCR